MPNLVSSADAAHTAGEECTPSAIWLYTGFYLTFELDTESSPLTTIAMNDNATGTSQELGPTIYSEIIVHAEDGEGGQGRGLHAHFES